MIEIYVLEQLKAFYDFGTLSAAAEHLHLAQPSLTRSMQKLENTLGVKLFDRKKNRIALNETGKLAAQYANRILNEEINMEQRVRAYDRSLHTISIGSCAPGPLLLLLPQASGTFPDMTVSSNIGSEDALLKGLNGGDYAMIILNHPLEGKGFHCQKYETEQLYLSVSHFHPAATMKSITFKEADGQNFIMHAHVGFWENIVRQKMPNAKFFLQDDMEAVGELQRSSDLPSFSTDISLRVLKSRQNNRVSVPFQDTDAFATYYLICSTKNVRKLSALLT